METASPPSQAAANFLNLAEVLARNFEANSVFRGEPASQVIVILGASASDLPQKLPSWTEDLKEKILDEVCRIFEDDNIFLEEICRTFSKELGYCLYGTTRAAKREAILKEMKVEQISHVACQMASYADTTVRELISKSYRVLVDSEVGQPPHLTYELLAHLIMHGFINHIVTMNFDEILDTALENELGLHGFKRIITGHETLDESSQPKLFKVHGTVSSPDSLRFTHADVSVLTQAQVKHLDALLPKAQSDCHCLNLVSFGYSWQDPDLAHWVLAHLGQFESIFIVRRQAGLPKLLASQSNLPREKFKVISTVELCGEENRAASSSLFWWCLSDQVCRRLVDAALIPFSRHLLLGNLPDQARSSTLTPLAKRVRMELLLHLLKSKGMINTFGASDSPRIRAYFARLRRVHERITVESFLSNLGLDRYVQISPEPEARDTFFSTADSVQGLVADVSYILQQEAGDAITEPMFVGDRLVARKVSAQDFIREQAERIAAAPEIEISRDVNVKLQWIFSSPLPILSFPQFAAALRGILKEPWTHLLAIVESKRWMSYPWIKDVFERLEGRKVLLILPSLAGLSGWKVGHALRAAEEVSLGGALHELEIPWWMHNRHLFLPVRCDESCAELGKGVYFLREHKSPAVAPIFVEEPRDRAKLLATFQTYARRSSSGEGQKLKEALAELVDCLVTRRGIDSAMLDLVEKAR